MRRTEQEELAEIIRQAMKKLGAKVVAADMDTSYSHLMGGINPGDGTHSLSVYQLVDLLDVTKNVAPLEVIAQRFNMTLAPLALTEIPSDSISRSLHELGVTIGRLEKSYLDAVHPDGPGGEDIVLEEAQDIVAEVGNIEKVLAEIKAAARCVIDNCDEKEGS